VDIRLVVFGNDRWLTLNPDLNIFFTFFVVRSTKSACISGNVHSANHSHSLSLFERQVWKWLCYIYRIYIALYPPLVPWNRGFAVCSLQLSAWWGALCLQCRTAKLDVIMSGLNGSLPTATLTYKILISINLCIKESVPRAVWPRRSNIPHLHVQLQSDDLFVSRFSFVDFPIGNPPGFRFS